MQTQLVTLVQGVSSVVVVVMLGIDLFASEKSDWRYLLRDQMFRTAWLWALLSLAASDLILAFGRDLPSRDFTSMAEHTVLGIAMAIGFATAVRHKGPGLLPKIQWRR